MPIEINTGNAPETESASALADKVREQAAQSILAMANGGATSADESQEQTPPAEKPDESPGERNGDLYGYNSLNRTNWFNGRFMDAEAFLRQDDFWSCRARMLAHIHPPGISWGLGFDMGGARLPDYPVNGALESHADGFSVDHVIALQPGLAFDDVGRPIMVERSHEFSLRELVAKYRERPRVAIAGGTQFSPCVCLRDDIGVLPTDRDAAILPGPYLLIIEAGETPEGEAKVYGEVCKTTRPVYCQANSWRGGYGLSLARYESDIPTDLGIHTGWDLRGTLSAYHFDVLEHSLIERWDPQVFLDGMFCAGTGPYRHDGNLIALAMVYLGPNENVAFFDPWIPRRPQVATAASTWCVNMLGAPAPSAAVARLHQFQCMLHESLEKRPMFEVLQKPGQPEKKDISGISRSTFESDNETSQKLRVYFTENPEFVENGMEFTVFEAESDENIVTITADERIDADVSNGSLWWCWTKLGSWAEGVDRITDDDIVRGSVEFSGEPVKFVEPLNLFQRGFRHIPPVGFLPIDPAGVDESFWKRVAEARQNLDGDRREDALRSGYAGTVNGILTRFARDLVKPYFEGTTVFPYYVVALHDDDIFEDIRNAFEKDPIVVQQMRLRWGKDTESKK